jgi:CheY-like chemotaxis protein
MVYGGGLLLSVLLGGLGAAEEADHAKEEFMAVVSHELRTPLNAVYGWAQMLQAGAPDDPALIARAHDAILRNAHLQVQLIDDLLDFSRITSGKMRLDLQQVDLFVVLLGALDAVRPAAEVKGVEIVTSLEPGTESVTGDPTRLQQVFSNLLMNSVKFTPKGGFVRLLVRHPDSHVEIVVEDSGQGIAPEILPHVFERFRQGDSTSTRAHGGLGLGLALVKHLVELHGGTVVARSPGLNRGATFTVTLPVAPVAPPPEPSWRRATSQPATLDSRSGTVRLDGLRVLVVDADCVAIASAEAILRRAGADVRTCPTGAEGLQVLRSWRPDVLVSDIEMPGENGYALIRKVRDLSAAEGGHTPAIGLSTCGRPQDRLQTVAAGFTMHVPKPVDPGELTTIVAMVASVNGPA